MPKKARKRSFPQFEKDLIGRFLFHLYGQLEVKPKSDWIMKKKEVRIIFDQFLNLSKNAKIRPRLGKAPAGKIGILLDRTGYLIDREMDSEDFCINLQKVMQYQEIEELHKTFKKKLVTYNNENKKLHRLSNKQLLTQLDALELFLPPMALLELKKKKFSDEALCEYSPQFENYFNGGRIFTPQNILGAMQLLLQIEDVDNFDKYRRLIQRNVDLGRSQPNRYSFKLTRISRKVGSSYEVLLSRYNRVLFVVECAETRAITEDQMLEFLMSGSLELNVRGRIIGTTYRGRIENVNGRKVTVESVDELPMTPKETYLIIFLPARLTIRHQYNALKLYGKKLTMLQHFLFPQPVVTTRLPRLCLSYYDKNIADNPEQVDAVHNIMESSQNARQQQVPYIIFGPPGTGKTSIIVESILQLLLHVGNAKILVTTGPNCACDEIALRICNTLSLGKNPRGKILARIYSNSQENRRENLNKLLLEYSNMYDWHFMPDVKVLEQYRIVVCTLSAVGKLLSGGLQYFTHVFLDEAAACSMSEGLIGVVGGLNEESKLILAGDHKQLGAILNSKRAETLGLGVSLMERLLQRECYAVNEANGDYNRDIQTRLCRNFRSHPAIVKLFNELYYDNKLEALASKENTNWAANWQALHDPTFPILFHSIRGIAQTDDDSGSLFNWEESDLVLSYVEDLLQNGLGNGRKLEEIDIGIISPYRSQCMEIQEELNMKRLFQIEIGTVETYRGKEKAVIIVSFVRSKFKSLGFLQNSKRINGIISRAKSLLILIGNDVTLMQHKDYEFIIKKCQQHGNFIPARKNI